MAGRFDTSNLRARLVASTKPRSRTRPQGSNGGTAETASTATAETASTAATARPPRARRSPAPAATPEPAPDLAELRAQRDRLVERFTVMEADLGGAFYEMAIRDHVRLDVLTRKAAELQRVDADLASVERALDLGRTGAAGVCQCGAPYAHGMRFCGQCGAQVASA